MATLFIFPTLQCVAVLACMLHLSTALFSCNGKIDGVINEKVVVKSGKCTVSENATVNGPITVKNGASLSIFDGAIVNGDIQLYSAGRFFSSGKYEAVTINGQITDYGSSGLFLLCGTSVSSRVKVANRVGEIVIGFGSCSPSSIKGSISIAGGRGNVAISGAGSNNVPLNGDITSLSITNRNKAAQISVWQTTIKDRLSVVKAGNLYIQDLVVRGQTNIIKNTFVLISTLKQFGAMKIVGTQNIVVASGIESRSVVSITNNEKGFTLADSNFNEVQCFGNTGPPTLVQNSSAITAKGQCNDFGL